MFSSASAQNLRGDNAQRLAQIYLQDARQQKGEKNLEIALVLYDQAKVTFKQVADERQLVPTLSQLKSAFSKAHTPQTEEEESLRQRIAEAYFERGQVLTELKQLDKAQASYKKAKEWGYDEAKLASTTLESHVVGTGQSPSAPLTHFNFPRNLPAPVPKYELPQPYGRLSDSAHLAYCLTLLSAADDALSPHESDWVQALDQEEKARLRTLADHVVERFMDKGLKKEATVAEVVTLAPVLRSDTFEKLLNHLISALAKHALLDIDLLKGLAQMIRNAPHDALQADNLVKILACLSERLQETHSQGTEYRYRLTCAVADVLDAMADTQVKDLDREKLHQPLNDYLQALKSSDDPQLVYQAAYAHQALQYVPDDETLWQSTARRAGTIIQGVSGVVSAVKAFDLNQFLGGLKQLEAGIGVIEGLKTIKETYDRIKPLAESGQTVLACLKEGLSFTHKSAWYPVLREADTLLKFNQFKKFETLIRQFPGRKHPVFLWGLCERLGGLAVDPDRDLDVQEGALRFLSEIYQDDLNWGHWPPVKERIVQMVQCLAEQSPVAPQAQKTLQTLAEFGDEARQAIYQSGLGQATPVRLFYAAPAQASGSTLLDEVQHKPAVDLLLRQLKRRRLKAFKEAQTIYIPPKGQAVVLNTQTSAPIAQAVELWPEVEKFLTGQENTVLLLRGDSGAGKSTFNRFVEFKLWVRYQKDQPIPLFITLPNIDQPEHQLIEKQLRREGFNAQQIQELKEHHRFVWICDGYDETRQTRNLYISNHLNEGGAWQGQMIISCRSEYLGKNYRSLFSPTPRNQADSSAVADDTARFQEYALAPFSDEQIEDYRQQYVQTHLTSWSEAQYRQAFDRTAGLKDLMRTPFLLRMVLETLPRLGKTASQLSAVQLRAALYDEFVKRWFERNQQRLNEQSLTGTIGETFKALLDDDFTQHGLQFVKDLAVSLYKENGGKPVVDYSLLKDQGSWKDAFFSREEEKQLLREAAPLTRSGNQYRFIHKSVLEYFAARAMIESLENIDATAPQTPSRRNSTASTYSFEDPPQPSAPVRPHLSLAPKHWVGEPAIVQLLTERVQQESTFKQQLFHLIERSKERSVTDQTLRAAAANAMTILVKAGVPLNGRDFNRIQVPGADLSYGVFDHTQFREADLRRVNFSAAWLRQTNCQAAQMDGVQLGEWPSVSLKETVYACGYSPAGQSWVIAAGKKILLYDAATFTHRQTFKGHTAAVRSVAFSPNGRWLASASEDQTVRLWSVTESTLLHTFEGHIHSVRSVAFSPDGQTLVSGSRDQTVRLWSATEGSLLHTFKGHTDSVLSVVFSPNGQTVASASWDQTVRLWSVEERTLQQTFEGHTAAVRSVAFSPNGQWLASGSEDKTVRLWSVTEGSLLHTFKGHTASVNSVVFLPNGQTLASGSGDKTVRLWAVDDPATPLQHTFAGHTAAVWSVVFSPNGDRLISGSGDRTVRCWSIGYPTPRPPFEAHRDTVFSVVFSPNGPFFASSSADQTVRLWSLDDLTLRHVWEDHRSWVTSLAFSPDGQTLVSGSRDKTVRLWSVTEGKLLHTFEGHTDYVRSVAFSPNGRTLASVGWDQTVRLWSLDDLTAPLRQTLAGHTEAVVSVAFSSDGQTLVSGSRDKTVRLWSVTEGKLLHTFEDHTDGVLSVAFSPNRQTAASGGWDQTVRLWSVKEGQPLHTFEGHTAAVWSVAFSPDGQMLASGSRDRTVCLWSVASGQCLAVVKGFYGGVCTVALSASPDGGWQLLTGSSDKAVRLWQVHPEGDQCRVTLRWTSTQAALVTPQMNLQAVVGLSPVNAQLLKQRGAIGEPAQAPQTLSVPQATLVPHALRQSRFGVLVQDQATQTLPHRFV